MKLSSLALLSALTLWLAVSSAFASLPKSIQPSGDWCGVEDYKISMPPYPVNTLPNCGDTFDNTGSATGYGFTTTSARSRPSNSTVVDLGVSANEATFKVTWTWEPTGTPPTYYLAVYYMAGALVNIHSGVSPSGQYTAGADAAVTGTPAGVSATTHGHSAPYSVSNPSDEFVEFLTPTDLVTCISGSHTVAGVDTAGQSFDALAFLYWWIYSTGV